MKKKNKYTALIIAAVLLTACLMLAFELTVVIFIALVALIMITHLFLKLSTVVKPYSEIKFALDHEYKPFVSIHVACKNEPAYLVIQTIKALLNIDYQNYEVIVIHSNNQDVENYRKIEEFIGNCGANYHFIHIDKISGFKAGALNYLNNHYLTEKVDVIAIVDCDYIVDSAFLSQTVGYFKNPTVGIVQLPQSYYNCTPRNVGLFNEYRSFFSLVMHQTQRYDLVTFTGTMGLIRASIIRNGLEWNEWCITEDSEAGLSINIQGFKGIYVDKTLGKGLMPFDYPSLAEQRRRWSYGNMQILMKNFYPVLRNKQISMKQKIAFVVLLTSWFHCELVIALLYLSINIMGLLGFDLAKVTWSSNLLLFVLAASLIGNIIYFVVGLRKEIDFRQRIKTFLSHYGLLWIMSSSWIKCLFDQLSDRHLEFIVTNKERMNGKRNLHQYWRELVIIGILITALIIKSVITGIMWIDIVVIACFITCELLGIYSLLGSFIED